MRAERGGGADGTAKPDTIMAPKALDLPEGAQRSLLWLGLALLGAMVALALIPRGSVAHLAAVAVGVGVGLVVVRMLVRHGGDGFGPVFRRVLWWSSLVAAAVALGWSAWRVIA